MREIKFRAKSTQAYYTHLDGVEVGDWVEGHYYWCRDRNTGIIITVLAQESGGVGSGLVQVDIEVDINTLGQFSGFKVKGKKDICEGDIINFHGDLFTIIFAFGAFGYQQPAGWGKPERFVSLKQWHYVDYEKIGNVHDNPELLKGE